MPPKMRRNHQVTVKLFTRQGTPLGDLEGVLGGQIDASAYATVKSTGSLTVKDVGQIVDGQWSQYRVQPIYTVNGEETPLGVFLPSTTTDDWDDTTRTWTVELADKTSILDGTVLGEFYTVPAGSNVVSTVKALIERSGEAAGAITPSTQTTLGTLTFEPKDTLLSVINDLLGAANFFSLWCDGEGQYQVTPATSVTARPITAEFVDGRDGTALYKPGFSREQDMNSIPNRVIAISSSDADEPAMTARAENRNPDSPFSFDTLGYWIDHVEENVETTSQEALQQYAQRRLESLSSAVANIEITHWFEPLIFNNAVRFRSQPARIDGRYTVSKYSIPLTELGLMKTTLREVVQV